MLQIIIKQYKYYIQELSVTISNKLEYSKIIKVFVSIFVHKFVRIKLELEFANKIYLLTESCFTHGYKGECNFSN